MKVSIVIPVYNEAEHLRACLEAISRQVVPADEVIVVDNNSTDSTILIAESFSFVTVLHERRQGVVYARDRGFNAATGDIIGRIDADTLISPDWIAMLRSLYNEDPDLAAVTGKVTFYGMALSGLLDYVDLCIRRRMARLLGREVAMQGANMAVRRNAWQQVRRGVCRGANMHEDHDLAIHLNRDGYLVRFDERIVVAIDSRRLQSTWRDFCKYAWLSPHTYSRHHLKSQRHMYPIVALAVVCYLPLKLLRRGFDVRTQRFSWRQALISPMTPRVNPATFVD